MVRKITSFALVAVSVGSLVYFLFENYSDFHFGNVLASQEVTSGVALQSSRNWMGFHEARISPFIKSCAHAGEEIRSKRGDGNWGYEAVLEKDRRYEFSRFGTCLGDMWINKLQALGYFKEPQDRPDPMVLTDFTIREPNGRTWVSSQDKTGVKTKQLFTLMVMMAISNDDWDVRPCMQMRRGTFPYAVAFTGIVRKLSNDQKIEVSCGDDVDARVMAAEMLMSLIPQSRPNATSNTFDSRAYEAMLEELAKPMSVQEKRSLFESFCRDADRLFKGDSEPNDDGSFDSPARGDRPAAVSTASEDGGSPVRASQSAEPGQGLGAVAAEGVKPERFTGFVKYAPAYVMCVLLVAVGLIPVCVSSGQLAAAVALMSGDAKTKKR